MEISIGNMAFLIIITYEVFKHGKYTTKAKKEKICLQVPKFLRKGSRIPRLVNKKCERRRSCFLQTVYEKYKDSNS